MSLVSLKEGRLIFKLRENPTDRAFTSSSVGKGRKSL